MPDKASRVQIFTPPAVARFMAHALIADRDCETPNILDAGAGAGALTDALIDRATELQLRPSLTLVENDPILADHLAHLVSDREKEIQPSSCILQSDFIGLAQEWSMTGKQFTHVAMNPPYAKITAGSETATALQQSGIPVSNLYAAFLWLGIDLLADGGRLVAILPRMLLSGPSFRRTREHMLAAGSVFQLHHFTSRKGVFGRDSVQQEVVVLGITRNPAGADTRFSISMNGDDVDDAPSALVPSSRLVQGGADFAILVPRTLAEAGPREVGGPSVLPPTVKVSVGSVVDFRVREYLVDGWDRAVPLVGSEVFATSKRRRGLKVADSTRRFVWAPGEYIVVRRIAPPEYQPRLAAALIDASEGPFADGVAFENHVLVIHLDGGPLPHATAVEILAALDAPDSHQQIAERVGGTQINAADIVALRRPPLERRRDEIDETRGGTYG